MPLERTVKPFEFKTQLSLVMMTGIKAADIHELKEGLLRVPESSIYYHTHHFLQQHQFLTPEPPNDFAYWVTNVLREEWLGEKLTAIDTMQYNSLNEVLPQPCDTIPRRIICLSVAPTETVPVVCNAALDTYETGLSAILIV